MRKIVAVVAGILVLVVAGGLGLIATVDPNDHRALIEDWLSATLGRPVRIAGPIELQRSMTPTVMVNDVRIGGPQQSAPISIGRAEASVALLSLLYGPLHLPRIGIDRATIDLPLEPGERSAAGAIELPRIDVIALSNIDIRYREDGTTLDAVVKTATFEPVAQQGVAKLAVTGSLGAMPFEVTGTTGTVDALFAGERNWPLRISAELGEGRLSVAGNLTLADGDPADQLDVALDLPAATGLARAFGLAKLPPVKATAKVQAGAGAIQIGALAATVGGSDVGGDLRLRIDGPRAVLTGKLTSDRIDLAELVPAAGLEAGQDQAASDGVIPNLPLLVPAAIPIDVDLDATIGQLQMPGQSLADLRARLEVRPDRVDLSLARAGLGEGSARALYTVDTGGSAIEVVLKLDLSKLDLATLFGKPQQGSRLPEDVTVEVDLTGTGDDLHAFLGSAHGPIRIATGAAVIDGALADLLGRSLFSAIIPDWSASSGAQVVCSVLDFDAKGGKAKSTAFVIDAQRVVVGGGGAIDLATGQIDFLLLPKAKNATLAPLVAPVHLSGTIAEPKIVGDASDVLSSAEHLLLGIVNPLSLATPLLHPERRGDTPCLDASLPAAEREDPIERGEATAGDAVKGATEGIGAAIEGVGDAASKLLRDATGQ